MNWLAFLVAILKTVAEISNYLGGRQLIEAGKAKALSNEAAAAVDDPNSAHSVRVRERYERTGQQDE
jgi:hypothetical protein